LSQVSSFYTTLRDIPEENRLFCYTRKAGGCSDHNQFYLWATVFNRYIPLTIFLNKDLSVFLKSFIFHILPTLGMFLHLPLTRRKRNKFHDPKQGRSL